MNIFRKLNHKRIELGRLIILKFFSFFEKRKMAKQSCDLENYKTIGILFVGQRIGDSVIMSTFLRPLKENGYSVVIICNKTTNLVLKNSQYVDKFVISDKIRGFKNMRALNIDLLIDVSFGALRYSNRIILKRKIQPKYSIYLYLHIKSNTEPSMSELTAVYNEAIIYRRYDRHIAYIYKTILSRLGIEVDDELEYEFNLDDSSAQEAAEIHASFSDKRIIIFNPYGSASLRNMSEEQTLEMLSFFSELNDFQTILIGEAHKITKLPAFDNVYCHIGNLHSAVALLSMSDLVVTVDTGIVHCARVFRKKMLALYVNSMEGKDDHRNFFAPFYDNAEQLFSPTKEITDFDVNILKDKIKQTLNIS